MRIKDTWRNCCLHIISGYPSFSISPEMIILGFHPELCLVTFKIQQTFWSVFNISLKTAESKVGAVFFYFNWWKIVFISFFFNTVMCKSPESSLIFVFYFQEDQLFGVLFDQHYFGICCFFAVSAISNPILSISP